MIFHQDEYESSFDSRKNKKRDSLKKDYCSCSNILTSLSFPWSWFYGLVPSLPFMVLGNTERHEGGGDWMAQNMVIQILKSKWSHFFSTPQTSVFFFLLSLFETVLKVFMLYSKIIIPPPPPEITLYLFYIYIIC